MKAIMNKMSSSKQIKSPHIPVLLPQVLESFSSLETGILIDCTLGYGGHSSALLKAHPNIKFIGIDRDPEALEFSKKRLEPFKNRIQLLQGDFSKQLPIILKEKKEVVGILADFGVSSLQLDKQERGFSFESESLDMRMDPSASLSAYDVVNNYSKERLSSIFRDYGEISQAKQLAQAIVDKRSHQTINTAKELAQLGKNILRKKGKTHPATQMFQAIRIEVNDELGEITRLLDTLEEYHQNGLIVSLITFHSLEDRLVKNRFRKWSRKCICPIDAPRCTCGANHALGYELNRKPISATNKEQKENPRSRSAKLRSFCFTI